LLIFVSSAAALLPLFYWEAFLRQFRWLSSRTSFRRASLFAGDVPSVSYLKSTLTRRRADIDSKGLTENPSRLESTLMQKREGHLAAE
jgi:hypothetical protein